MLDVLSDTNASLPSTLCNGAIHSLMVSERALRKPKIERRSCLSNKWELVNDVSSTCFQHSESVDFLRIPDSLAIAFILSRLSLLSPLRTFAYFLAESF
ncbi:hypothetical protein CEXT_177791 [Caerostris extrusa]|uniref:Uncharacterized protein n=1 Tax=Caerostris extrusa TaxID=172846 RepID=A0AAV4T9G7_CAEEX|nr:hypothetical protein CEXT_177791 [Caerostris extrusa]